MKATMKSMLNSMMKAMTNVMLAVIVTIIKKKYKMIMTTMRIERFIITNKEKTRIQKHTSGLDEQQFLKSDKNKTDIHNKKKMKEINWGK